MFWGRLPFVTLSFGYGTNIILAQHHHNNIAVSNTQHRYQHQMQYHYAQHLLHQM